MSFRFSAFSFQNYKNNAVCENCVVFLIAKIREDLPLPHGFAHGNSGKLVFGFGCGNSEEFVGVPHCGTRFARRGV